MAVICSDDDCGDISDSVREETDEYEISTESKVAVTWRNTPDCAGRILVFVQGDVDKLHSLNVFDQINKKDIPITFEQT